MVSKSVGWRIDVMMDVNNNNNSVNVFDGEMLVYFIYK